MSDQEFRAAKPVGKKERPPFPEDPEPLSKPMPVAKEPVLKSEPASPYALVLRDLYERRDELDKAIELIESLMP
jgi:hypothetical protein